MVETSINFELYSVPSKPILQKRKDFYCLRRQKRESTTQWLDRIQKCIKCCKFPSFIEFLLIDRFVCGLDATELKTIEKENKSWTLKQLMELCSERKTIENRKINTNGALPNESINRSQAIIASAEIVKTV